MQQTDQRIIKVRFGVIISAIFMPLTLIAGIYGMNLRKMPELASRYGYPATIILMFILAGGLLGIFYWKGWFKRKKNKKIKRNNSRGAYGILPKNCFFKKKEHIS